MNHVSDTTAAENGGNFDPQQAAALLDQTTQRARRTFMYGSAPLWTFRAVVVLVAGVSFWLSLRGAADPYSAPGALALAATFSLVAINIVWSAVAIKRAGSGVTGPAERARRAWLGVTLAAWVVAYVVTTPLYHAGLSHPVWGLYPANGPLLIVAAVAAVAGVAQRNRRMGVTCLVIVIVTAAAGFGGPAGAWLIMGIGVSAAMLGTAAFTVWDQRRNLVQS
jgi:hypothetical protein